MSGGSVKRLVAGEPCSPFGSSLVGRMSIRCGRGGNHVLSPSDLIYTRPRNSVVGRVFKYADGDTAAVAELIAGQPLCCFVRAQFWSAWT